jgi:ABC-type dipeptide/oligopeptide/nickel transport system permease component
MRFGRYILRRLVLLIPQLLGISLITFLLIHLIPGDPAYTIAGSLATQENIKNIQHRMGLDQPLPVQYLLYMQRLSHGDLGDSYIAGRPVRDDLAERLPATVELITISFMLAVVIAVPLGVLLAMRGGGGAQRAVMAYGLLAGAIPDFWLALLLTFVFYFQLHWLPAPIGQLDIAISPPQAVTGMLLIDSVIAGDGDALASHLAHLVLPVVTLTLLYAAPILKMTRSSMDAVLGSGFVRYSRAAGLPTGVVMRYALRNALSPVVTLVGVLYSILLSGAVLVEQVYGWGGAGQYAVQSILNSDYLAIQGFVLVAGCFALLVYLVVDIIHMLVDPRIQH